jgi:hypothetical protein
VPFKSCKEIDNSSQGMMASEFGDNKVVEGRSGFFG